MLNETRSGQKDEESKEEQIHTVVLDGVEMHRLKMIALCHLEENTSARQILQDTLTGHQADVKQVYDTAKAARKHRENNDNISQYDDIRMSVSDTDVTAIITALSEYPEEESAAWQLSLRRLVDQVGGDIDNV